MKYARMGDTWLIISRLSLGSMDQALQSPAPYPNWFNPRNPDRISEKTLAP